MSKLGKSILFGVIVIVIGVVILITALAISGWKLDSDFEMKVYDCSTEISSFNLDFDMGYLKTQFYDGEKIKIEYPENRSLKTTFTETEDGTLKMVTKKHFKLFQFNMWFDKVPTTVVSVPRDSVLNLDLKINTGKVEVASGDYGNITIDLNAGEINFEDISCKDNICNINAGKVNFKTLNSLSNTFKLNAGSVKITDFVGNDVDTTLNAGNFDITNASCKTWKMKVNAGDIYFGNLTCQDVLFNVNAGNIKVNTWIGDILKLDVDAGTINVVVGGAKSDYSISVDKTSGSCNLQGQTGQDSNKRIEVDLDAGNIDVNFTS